MVHQYKFLNQNIVLDISSGGVYSVDEIAYDIISLFDKMDKDKVVEKLLLSYADKNVSKEILYPVRFCIFPDFISSNRFFTRSDIISTPLFYIYYNMFFTQLKKNSKFAALF
jgi:hypothetical protein